MSVHTKISVKTTFCRTVQSTASPSSGTIRITKEGEKDIGRKQSFHIGGQLFFLILLNVRGVSCSLVPIETSKVNWVQDVSMYLLDVSCS